MKKSVHLKTILLLLCGFFAHAQELVWTGLAANNDFYDEANWKNPVTNVVPLAGVIDPGVAISLPLSINNVVGTITANGDINLGTGSLSVGNANLTAVSFTAAGGNVVVNEGAYVTLTDTTPFKVTTPKIQINFTSGLAWIKTTNYSARLLSIINLGQIKVNGSNAVYTNNLRLDNYYLRGCVIRSNDATTAPLTIYDSTNLQGASALIPVNTIHSADAIAGAMNNKIESFILKKGFMVTFADENDGTGSSKNYIASDADLVINSFPKLLQNSISFIRVLPWNWVTKKGRTDTGLDLNTSWRYQWNANQVSTVNWEYVPMSWGHGTTSNEGIANFISKYGSPHVMSFNEPDDCEGQSGQHGFAGSPKLCVVDEAVRLHKNLMKTGMRLVSPGGREEAPFGWLKEFYNKAKAEDVRIDVIAVHWYDWGSNPAANPNPTALQVFNRFKAYLANVHNLYGLPIWITEFNANPARSQAVNSGFLALALPYLESLDYIERYNWFPYNTGTHFYTSLDPGATTLSQVGTIYKNINNTTPTDSTPAIPEATVDFKNNLDLLQFPNVALNKPATANSSFTSTSLPSMAVDGNSTLSSSLWALNFGNLAGANLTPLPAWFEVDLQGSYTIDSFRIFETSSTVRDFNFQVWDASLNSGAGGWSDALTVTGNPSSPLTTYKTISPVTTTKVRLYITAHNSATLIRMFELEVYGRLASNLGVANFIDSQPFSIYPNPVSSGVLNITSTQEIESVEVFSILGSKINIPYQNNQLLVDDLAAGIYFLKINNKYSFKFIKK